MYFCFRGKERVILGWGCVWVKFLKNFHALFQEFSFRFQETRKYGILKVILIIFQFSEKPSTLRNWSPKAVPLWPVVINVDTSWSFIVLWNRNHLRWWWFAVHRSKPVFSTSTTSRSEHDWGNQFLHDLVLSSLNFFIRIYFVHFSGRNVHHMLEIRSIIYRMKNGPWTRSTDSLKKFRNSSRTRKIFFKKWNFFMPIWFLSFFTWTSLKN